MKRLAYMGLALACWLGTFPAQASMREDFLTAVKELAAEEGILSADAKAGILDEPLYEFGQVVCRARTQRIAQQELLAWMEGGVSKCTSRDLLLTAMAAADTYLCPSVITG